MKNGKWLAITAAALVLGLALGNIGSAVAAGTVPTSGTVASAVASCGLGIGRTLRDSGGRLIDVVASLTGKSVTEIQAERADGKSLAQIAESNDVKSDAVVDKALELRKKALDDSVKAGTITQDQADSAFDTMKTRLSTRIDSTEAGCGGGGCGAGGGGGRGGMGRGMGGGACAGAQTSVQ